MFPPQLIVADRIGHGLKIGSKKRLLEVLAELLGIGDQSLTPEAVFEHLRERERLGSTGLGHGIALPHARMKHVKEATAAFIQLQKGVSFDAIDDKPVDLAFALLVPESANEMHLQLLSQLATMFSDARLRQNLREARSPEHILGLLQQRGNDPEDA
jgi:PTS system nitrogen regulatory IIA component